MSWLKHTHLKAPSLYLTNCLTADTNWIKPAELAYEDMVDAHFVNTYRNQFVGIAINTSGMEVTVMRMSYLSFLTHGFRRMKKEGLIGDD